MSENATIPYLLQLKDAVNAIHLTDTEANNTLSEGISLNESTNIMLIPSYNPGIEQVCMQPAAQIIEKTVDTSMEIDSQKIPNGQINFIYEVVYPEQLNLKPVYNLKRGRPKKKKKQEVIEEVLPEPPKPIKPAPRTRSGRVVKFPKHIEKDFTKIEIEDGPLGSEEPEIKTSEFIRFVDDLQDIKKTNDVQLEFHQRRRKISAQYKCPKCQKAYLGKIRMIKHIQKYPDHGPLPHDELNFDVWNYLVDITQKCPPGQRGIKFCEELTNLLHNVLLLTSALFKKAELNKNYVDVDKVLGNAIGLPPGPYKFNDSELYKDVTVLKLITNSDFFKPLNTNEDYSTDHKTSTTEANKVKEAKEQKKIKEPANNDFKTEKERKDTNQKVEENKEDLGIYFNSQQNINNFSVNATETNNDEVGTCPLANSQQNRGCNSSNRYDKNGACPVTGSLGNGDCNSTNNYDKHSIDHSAPDSFIKKNQSLDDRLPVHTDLLSDNSLLNLPNLRNSVDDLLSGVDSATNLLDNSTSSDEVMNVDQFVNERFKKITEPDIEISGLDLPSLDLFQFHTS